MNQVAKLFLRGSLINKVAKNLNNEQSKLVEELMMQAWNDSLLSNAKHEFCLALKRTIKNEYVEREVGMQDALITFWRTAVDVLFGNHDENWDIEKIKKNSLSIKKIFQTWLFNYLKQILRENTRPNSFEHTNICDRADIVVVAIVQSYIDNLNKDIKYDINKNSNNKHMIMIDTSILSQKFKSDIEKLSTKFKDKYVIVSIKPKSINVYYRNPKIIKAKISSKTMIKTNSIFNTSDDENNDFCKYLTNNKPEKEFDLIESTDFLQSVLSKVDDTSKQIINIISNPPFDFYSEYSNANKTNIAKYLKISKIKVNKCFDNIKTAIINVNGI